MSSVKDEYIWKGVIKTQEYDYTLIITTAQITKNEENIIYSRYFNFGVYTDEQNEKKTCVDVYVMYEALTEQLPNINYKRAKLITTHYDSRCSIGEKLERGDGTRHMINTALTFVLKMCPFIEEFEINDASTRICDNNTTITLSYFSITQYGKTWYEKNFNAFIPKLIKKNRIYNNKTIKNTNNHIEIDKMTLYKNTVNELLSKSLPEWDIFNILFLRNMNINKTELQILYKKSKTYGELFKHIHELGISNACIYLQPWIDQLMLSTDLKNYILFTQWVIPKNKIGRVRLLNYSVEYFKKK
jgi:hypothetical protein